MAALSVPLEERMKRYTLPLSCGCYMWVGFQDKDGYGVIRNDGRNLRAHRAAVELASGVKLRPADIVCHHCDNPSCVNPEHLYVGTVTTNNRDTVRRGRRAAGQPMNQEMADRIRQAVQEGESRSSVARRLGISLASASRIASGKRWNQ